MTNLNFFIWKRSNNVKAKLMRWEMLNLVIIPQEKMVISIFSDMDRPHPENKTIIEKALQV